LDLLTPKRLFLLPCLICALVLRTTLSHAQEYTIANWYKWKQAAVVLTYDDWSIDHPMVAIPELDSAGLRGTFFINGWAFDWTPDILQEAVLKGHEIANHTNNHVNLLEASEAERIDQIIRFQNLINERLPNQRCQTFSYPFGFGGGTDSVSLRIQSLLKSSFIGARAVINQIWTPDFGGDDYYRLPAMTVKNTTELQDIQNWVNEAIQKKGLAIIMYHGVSGNDSEIAISTEEYKRHLQAYKTRSSEIWVATFSDMIKYHKEANSAVLSTLNRDNSIWNLSFTDTLPDDIYNHPLSLSLTIPQGFQVNSLQQGTSALLYQIEDDKLIFEAVPDQGTITISNGNQQVAKLTQQITFDLIEEKKTIDEPFTVSAQASSGLPVTFRLLSGPAKLEGNLITLDKIAGRIQIEAIQEGDEQYLPATSIIREFEVRRTPQAITFNAIDTVALDVLQFDVQATASSGLPVAINIVSGPAKMTENKIELLGQAGTIVLEATQSGDQTYLSAVKVQQRIEVIQLSQILTFDSIPEVNTLTPPIPLTAEATSGLPVAFRFISGPGLIQNDTLYLEGDTGRIVIEAFQIGNDTYLPATPVQQAVRVTSFIQTITADSIPDKLLTAPPFLIPVQATSELPVLLEILSGPARIEADSCILLKKAGTVVIQATQPGDAQFAPAIPVLIQFEVNKLNQKILPPSPIYLTTTQPPFSLQIEATSQLPVDWTLAAGPATQSGDTLILDRKAGQIDILASQPGNDIFEPATDMTISFVVQKASQTIQFDTIPNVFQSTDSLTLSAKSSSGLPVSFSILQGPAFLTDSILRLTGFRGLVRVEANQPGNDTYERAIPVVKSFNVLPTPVITSDQGAIPSHERILVYPNPTSDILQLELTNQQDKVLSLEVYTLEGKHQHIPISPSFSISFMYTLNMSHLPVGMYLLRLNMKERHYTFLIAKTP